MGHEAELEIPGRIRNKTNELPNGVLNAYVYGRLTFDQKRKVEEIMANSKNIQKIVEQKRLDRLRLRKMIPDVAMESDSRKSLSMELDALTQQSFPPDKKTIIEKWMDRIAKFLDKTIFEF